MNGPRSKAAKAGSQAQADRPTLSREAVLHSCERSDRILRAVLGETAERTMLRFVPALVLLLLAAAVATAVD